jgi:serine O-acetyltransferase
MKRPLERIVRARGLPVIGLVARLYLAVFAVEIPPAVTIGPDFRLVHRGTGVVLNAATRIGAHVTVYHAVTTARADSWVPLGGRAFPGVEFGDWSVICPGTVVLAGDRLVRVGEGTVIGANSTLRESTGDWEIWAGNPARKVGVRRDRPRGYEPGASRS